MSSHDRPFFFLCCTLPVSKRGGGGCFLVWVLHSIQSFFLFSRKVFRSLSALNRMASILSFFLRTQTSFPPLFSFGIHLHLDRCRTSPPPPPFGSDEFQEESLKTPYRPLWKSPLGNSPLLHFRVNLSVPGDLLCFFFKSTLCPPPLSC